MIIMKRREELFCLKSNVSDLKQIYIFKKYLRSLNGMHLTNGSPVK